VTAEQFSPPPELAPDLTLGPATRLLWRSPDAVHLELGRQAVIVEGLPSTVVSRIASPVAPARPTEPLPESVRAALATLADAGFLWSRARPAEDDPRLAPPEPRLAGQLTALVPRHGGDAAQLLGARRYASVEVTGRSRVVPHVAAVLAAAGIGQVRCAVDGTTRLQHLVPGGATAADEGTPLAQAAEAAVRRAAPEADTRPLPADDRPDLTIIAAEAPIPEERLAALHAADAPYLAVQLGLDSGVVGPLVLPGLTSCLRCADRHRSDRDPAWAALAVQLTVERRYGPAADVAVATIIAGVAAQQALAFLDGDSPATLDGTIELQLPDWRLRRRSWSMHPECTCAAEPADPETVAGPTPTTEPVDRWAEWPSG
jgi:bacteriocin biosynthesis cyclodehydratase domain-containing protein